jgi:hypothetical protein
MPRLRIAAAVLILALLVFTISRLAPFYLDNMRLQSYVEGIAQDAANRTRPDDMLRVAVLEKAASLGLPVTAGDVQIKRSNETMRVDVRYIVHVDFPLYTVDLHFYPGAGQK